MNNPVKVCVVQSVNSVSAGPGNKHIIEGGINRHQFEQELEKKSGPVVNEEKRGKDKGNQGGNVWISPARILMEKGEKKKSGNKVDQPSGPNKKRRTVVVPEKEVERGNLYPTKRR